MNINIKVTNIELTPRLREYIMEKFGSLERFFPNTEPDLIVADIEIGKPSQHHRKGEEYLCDATVTVGGYTLRAEEMSESIHGAVDIVRDEIERQARKLKSKRHDESLWKARAFARMAKFFRFRRRE